LIIAASVKRDDILMEWIRYVVEARCSKRYTPEYHRLLPNGDSEQPWLWSFEEFGGYDGASAAVAKIEGEIHHREQLGKSKI
jgi:hypothetical protein